MKLRPIKTHSRGRLIAGFIVLVGFAASVLTIGEKWPSHWWPNRFDETRETQEHIDAIAALVGQENPKVTSNAIQGHLNLMYRDGLDMKDIIVPDVILVMAEFKGVDWSGAQMENAEFTCSNRGYKEINDWEEGDPKVSYCAQLRDAKFVDSSLREIHFEYADLTDADFTDADLTKAKIYDSNLWHADFLDEADLRALQVDGSNFSHAEFSSKAEFRCMINSHKCANVRVSNFSSTTLAGTEFSGASVVRVDFTDANLKSARFDCESPLNGEERCTILDELCVEGADFTEARFDGIRILNTDFSGADLTDAWFENVQFENVVFPIQQVQAAKKFGDESLASLDAANKHPTADNEPPTIYDDPDDEPCSHNWHRNLNSWLDTFPQAQ